MTSMRGRNFLAVAAAVSAAIPADVAAVAVTNGCRSNSTGAPSLQSVRQISLVKPRTVRRSPSESRLHIFPRLIDTYMVNKQSNAMRSVSRFCATCLRAPQEAVTYVVIVVKVSCDLPLGIDGLRGGAKGASSWNIEGREHAVVSAHEVVPHIVRVNIQSRDLPRRIDASSERALESAPCLRLRRSRS